MKWNGIQRGYMVTNSQVYSKPTCALAPDKKKVWQQAGKSNWLTSDKESWSWCILGQVVN